MALRARVSPSAEQFDFLEETSWVTPETEQRAGALKQPPGHLTGAGGVPTGKKARAQARVSSLQEGKFL